jgi:hypothetical protein
MTVLGEIEAEVAEAEAADEEVQATTMAITSMAVMPVAACLLLRFTLMAGQIRLEGLV